MNPVLPSPWRSAAPHGISHASKSSRLSLVSGNPSFSARKIRGQLQTTGLRAQIRHNILKKCQLFKDLNKSTLLLNFPQLSPNQIDAALALSENDLSEAINLLRLRMEILKKRKQGARKLNPPQTVKYIPTKFKDVQIVEIVPNRDADNLTKIQKHNNNNSNLQLPEICKVPTLFPPNTISRGDISSMPSNTVIAASQNAKIRNEVASGSEFSPVSTVSSNVYSDDADKLKVYDFAEDEPIGYHLPKPTRKPPTKVGIVLVKSRSGLQVKLL